MTKITIDHNTKAILDKKDFARLIKILQEQGYTVIGPHIVDDVVSLRPIDSVKDLPIGYEDEQEKGEYSVKKVDCQSYFQYVVGQDNPRRYFMPPSQRLMSFHVDKKQFVIDQGPPQAPKLAFLGLRACDLASIQIQDRVVGYGVESTFRCESDTYYGETRRQSILIAVNCTRPGNTCFCSSMNTGPKAKENFDIALTELRQSFIVEVGSEKGKKLAQKLPLKEASESDLELAELKLQNAAKHMGRQMETEQVRKLLNNTIEDSHWDKVADKCLSCGNCTMVCPTCFCCTVTDSTDITGTKISRTKEWESCFTHQFSYASGGPQRNTIKGRYRQWMRHKLCTWWDQFGSSGCVGCGRCITWCPVGIDITEEVETLRQSNKSLLNSNNLQEVTT